MNISSWLRINKLLMQENGSKTRKPSRTEQLQRENRATVKRRATTAVATTTGCSWWQPWPNHGGVWLLYSSFFSSVASCCFIIDRGICHSLPVLGHFGLFLLSSLIHMASKWSSIHMFRGCTIEIWKTLKTSKITYNRRNRGINHITIHFKPLKWLLNT